MGRTRMTIHYLRKPITDPAHPDARAAVAMRNMDEHIRNALIAQGDNLIDGRDRFEAARVPHDAIEMAPFGGWEDE